MALTLKSIHLSNRPGPQQREKKHSFLSPACTLQSLRVSTHSEPSVFTILYNKYSDAIPGELARPKMTMSNKLADAALEQSTIGQRPVWGTNALGRWVSLEQLHPGTHAHMGWGGGEGRRGAEGPHSGPGKVLVTEVDPELSRAPHLSQSLFLKQVGGPFVPPVTTAAVRKGRF